MVLVLAVIWASFGIWWFRSHAQASLGDSVGSFRRDLHVLERTAPSTLPAANRLRVPVSSSPAFVARRSAARPMTPAPAAVRRRSAAKRRRDVLFVLAVTVVATLAMAAATRSHTIVGLQLLADAAFGGYIALLVRMRNVAAEREMKLSYLPSARPAARHRAAGPDGSYGTSYGAGLGSYADLALRRTAN